ncbi:MAG: pyridoxal-dependent decarboxylase [Robiginitalea sp.]|nr:pyridoxal-dependent decarboxylase [Robiginitalea sp.]
MSLSKGQGTQMLGPWFLGPKAESHALLTTLLSEAMHHAVDGRECIFPEDPAWADPESAEYIAESTQIRYFYKQLVKNLEQFSVPFSSYRYQGHMLWDQSLPSVVGYFAAMLYNQNNVAAEASPLTTALEIEVAQDLCRMVGFGKEEGIQPWGHITCDGSVANIEALWAARNTKLYPLAVYAALKKEKALKHLDYIKVQPTGKKTPKRIIDLDWWELINLRREVVLGIRTQLFQEANNQNIDISHLELIQNYTVQGDGIMAFAIRMDKLLKAKGDLLEVLAALKVMGPATAHYSLPKATTLLGLGTGAFVKVPVEANARVDIKALKELLNTHLKKKLPVMTVVAVMGTTEESAVDNLKEILKIREDWNRKGIDFFIHADGAWGGYFASLLQEPESGTHAHKHLEKFRKAAEDGNHQVKPGTDHFHTAVAYEQLSHKDGYRKFMYTNCTGLNTYTAAQLEALKHADSITVDPHKSGFTLYPSGSLLYRDHRVPEMIRITASVVYHEGDAPTVGVFGVEGSKPGAAAASVYFSHRVIRTDQSGYGRILGRCTFNAKRVFSGLMAIQSSHFEIAALTDLKPKELNVVRSWSKLSNLELWDRLSKNAKEFELFRRTGPDLNIISYALNPIIKGKPNKDPKVTNDFNNALFKKLSSQSVDEAIPRVIVTSSSLEAESSSEPIKSLRRQLGVKHDPDLDMNFLITTVMNPWLTDAANGERNMVPEVLGYFQEEAEMLVDELFNDPSNTNPTS